MATSAQLKQDNADLFVGDGLDAVINGMPSNENSPESNVKSSEPTLNLPVWTVSRFLFECNTMLEADFDDVVIEGEVASFKINQGKWVFFDLKENEASVSCFMPLFQLNVAVQDGMKVRVKATPKITRWGKFSLTIKKIQPVGVGNIKKSFELLKQKLKKEGLFDPARKRPIRPGVTKIGVISSVNAAGYADFLKILGNRWGGLEITVINTMVQGLNAPEQICRALDIFNEKSQVEVVAILRGGGSADDLAAFNDEMLARKIAASKIPVITGIGHEVDESLADLVADVRASTPSNAAERLTFDRRAVLLQVKREVRRASDGLTNRIDMIRNNIKNQINLAKTQVLHQIDLRLRHIKETEKILLTLNPENVLKRGYAIITGDFVDVGQTIDLVTEKYQIKAEVKDVKPRK